MVKLKSSFGYKTYCEEMGVVEGKKGDEGKFIPKSMGILPGDLVTWNNESKHLAPSLLEQNKKNRGDGPFRIIEVLMLPHGRTTKKGTGIRRDVHYEVCIVDDCLMTSIGSRWLKKIG